MWNEAVVVRPPELRSSTHLLRVYRHDGVTEDEVDLDECSHVCLPLYAYDV